MGRLRGGLSSQIHREVETESHGSLVDSRVAECVKVSRVRSVSFLQHDLAWFSTGGFCSQPDMFVVAHRRNTASPSVRIQREKEN